MTNNCTAIKRLKTNNLSLYFFVSLPPKHNIIESKSKHTRLLYIDALRSFAILMMLQGHFISSLLNEKFKDSTNEIYQVWEYFRGITAPTFFTITGFIFFFLILKEKRLGWENNRIKKGIIRGLKLIGWGYILRIGIGGVLLGYHHDAYYYTDVLHIIGVSLILLSLLYATLSKFKLMHVILLSITVFSFLFERLYSGIRIPFLPEWFSHYFSNANGAIFSLFPWFGFVSIGAFLAIIFTKYQYQNNLYWAMPIYLGVSGLFLMYFSSPVLFYLHEVTGIEIFILSADYNYLFSRLGDVLLLFSLFVYARNFLKHPIFIQIGKVTLSIYIVHHILLYGSWFNTGIIRWLYHSLTLNQALFGALIFMFVVTFLVFKYRTLVNTFFTEIQRKMYYRYRIMKVAITRR